MLINNIKYAESPKSFFFARTQKILNTKNMQKNKKQKTKHAMAAYIFPSSQFSFKYKTHQKNKQAVYSLDLIQTVQNIITTFKAKGL